MNKCVGRMSFVSLKNILSRNGKNHWKFPALLWKDTQTCQHWQVAKQDTFDSVIQLQSCLEFIWHLAIPGVAARCLGIC